MNSSNTIHCLNFPELKYAKEMEDRWAQFSIKGLDEVSFFYLDNDEVSSRVLLRKILNSTKNGHCILVSENKSMAFLAWKANLLAFFHFDDKEISQSWTGLINRIKKYPPSEEQIEEKLRINFKGGFDLVNIKNICFCVGSGNYTYIYLESGIKKCISYPLSNLEKRLKDVGFLKRIGKSFIVNINRVKKINKEEIVFKGSKEIDLKLGSVYIKRIKQNLLWY